MTDTVFDITGKVTIVTGGGTGIGADIAREFCTRGARVMITSRTRDHLGPVADRIRQAGGMIEAMVGDPESAVPALIPVHAHGMRIKQVWDTLSMRATRSDWSS